MKKFLLNHFEGIIIFFVSVISACLFFKYFLVQANLIYINSNLNSTFITLFGGLLGLLLTAYAIVKRELFEIKIVLTAALVSVIAILLGLDLFIFTPELLFKLYKALVLVIFLY